MRGFPVSEYETKLLYTAYLI